jgi:hypothetical protein
MMNPERDVVLREMNIYGIPYFFGISLFIFEGNTLVLEIYHQMED